MSLKTTALICSSIVGFLIAFSSTSLNVALPAIGKEFSASAIMLSWMVTCFILATAVFSLPFGRMADIIGLRKVFISGLIFYTAMAAACALSVSSMTLIIFRSIMGISGAMIISNSVALLTTICPKEERGKALGINVACVYSGASLGPFLGGILTQYLGWRSIFILNIPAGLLVLMFLIWKVKGEWRGSKGEKFDYIGSLTYGIALVLLIYGFSLLPDIPGAILILTGTVGLFVFVMYEKRTTSPVLNVNIFRNNRAYIFSNVAALVDYCSVFAVGFLLSLYLQYVKGLTPQWAGIILVAQPVVQAVISPFAGRLSDRIEPRIVASVGMTITFTGLVSNVFLEQNTGLVRIIISLIVLGIGFALFSSPNTNAIMTSVAPKFFGVASATMFTVRSIGMNLSMGITMMVLATVVGRVVITPAYHSALLTSIKICFSVFSVLCFAGIFASLSRGKVR